MSTLLHIKGSRTKVLKTLPNNSFGNDGDIVISTIQGRGVYLCSKANGRWYSSTKFEELNKIEKTSIKDLALNRLKIKNTTLTPNEYDVAVGDLTLDVAGDIVLNADGGQVTIKDDTASHFLFDCDSTQFAIYDDTDVADFFTITVGASGITTLATVDAGAAVGHLTLAPDGNLLLSPGTNSATFLDASSGSHTGFTFDKNYTATTGGNTIATLIDYDITGVMGNGASINARGLVIGINSNVPTHHANSEITNYGMELSITGGTSGTQTNYGINSIVTGADTNIGFQSKVDDGGVDIKLLSSADTGDYCSIATTTHGATTLTTVDDNATAAHLTLALDGDLIVDAAGDIELNADGGTVTIKDGSASHFLFDCDNTRLRIYDDTDANHYFTLGVDTNGATTLGTSNPGTTAHMTLVPDGDLILDPASAKVIINATDDLYFDGGGDTYITEGAGDSLHFTVGGDRCLQIDESGDNGNGAWFRESCAGFTRREATFSETGAFAFGDLGGLGDTDIDFRFSNKYRLEMTNDIANMNLIMPPFSANLVLVCTTNGDHDVTNWKVYESDESAATVTDVMWAGGSVPAFTSSGVDIVSFYWDYDEQECYGVASLAFATP